MMDGTGGSGQKITPLARELSRIFSNYNKHSNLLKKNLKETNKFFREIKQNYSNSCAAAGPGASVIEAALTRPGSARPSPAESCLRLGEFASGLSARRTAGD
ncbi:UNVERIFIED_CONTAM: hypothetical protein FKN15_054503 [Acipenser sinensis]